MADCDGPASELRTFLADRIGPEALERFLSQPHIATSPYMAEGCGPDRVRPVVVDTLRVMRTRRAAMAEAAEAQENRDGLTSEVETTRLKNAAEARFLAESGPKDDRIEYDIAPSGAKMVREERNALDRAIGGVAFAGSNRAR